MQRAFQVDLEKCPLGGAAIKLRAIVTEPVKIRRYLRYLDEATELPRRAPARDRPCFQSPVNENGFMEGHREHSGLIGDNDKSKWLSIIRLGGR